MEWFTLDLFNKNALIKQYYDSLKLKNKIGINNGSRKDFITQGEINFKTCIFPIIKKVYLKILMQHLNQIV